MRKRILITVLTYPCPSDSHIETVCTAGITDKGEWVRIYPIQLRMMGNGLHKYNWYDFEVEQRSKDFRKESFHCLSVPDGISKGVVSTENDWELRRKICIDEVGFYTNIEKLLDDGSPVENPNFISLATFKPSRIIDFRCVHRDIEKDEEKKDQIIHDLKAQPSLFGENEVPDYWKMAKSIPYDFKYKFADDSGTVAEYNVEDWEVGSLYLNCLKASGSEEEAIRKVKSRYFDDFLEKDLYFFMGTRLKHQQRHWRNPFSIIGVFYPPVIQQPSLF
ncbi:MAG: hypothetical protein PHS20_08115 [Sphaerochaetaceae bacterium]|nr:hypothetical protein [Sphaerochaetaceae bacterium]